MKTISPLLPNVIACLLVVTQFATLATAQGNNAIKAGTLLELTSPETDNSVQSAFSHEFDAMDRERSERINRIRRLLDEIKRKASQAARTTSKTGNQPTTGSSHQEPKSIEQRVRRLTKPEAQTPATNPPSAPKSVPESPPENALRTETRLVANTSPKPFTKTVDRLALANNLFVQGQVDVAGPIYEQLVQLPQSPADTIWIQYQLASCYRMQGRPADAKKLYRLVASSKEEEYWSSRALWWLDYLSKTERFLGRQTKLQSQMDAMRKEVNEFQNK